MANISIRKSNFTAHQGYFYTFDDDQDALLQKTADGTTAFSYLCDNILSTEVTALEFDGVNFWSMQYTGGDVSIKRWQLDNYIVKLRDTFDHASTSTHVYETDSFAVEHYHTNLTTTVSGASPTIYIDNYTNNAKIIDNAILHLGPNINGDEEDVVVIGTVFGGVELEEPTLYAHAITADVNFHKRLWLFNNNDGNDTENGALYKFDSHTGGYMEKYPGGAYRDISASTFSIVESFSEVGNKDMLVYTKGANTLFVNVEEDKKTLYNASEADDDFSTGTIIPEFWSVSDGSPIVETEQLKLSLSTQGTVEGIRSVYYLTGDFDVYVDGFISNYDTTYSGTDYIENSLKAFFPNEQDRYCKISRGYSTEFGGEYYNNMAMTSKKDIDELVSSIAIDIDTYGLRLRRVTSDIHAYYRTVVSGINGSWQFLGTKQMFDTDVQISLSSTTAIDHILVNYFDNVTYTEGYVAYITTATELPYYGSMVMDNIAIDGFTIDPLYDMSIDNLNLYRLHGGNPYDYELSPLEPFVTSISISATPAILAANGLSTTDIKAWVKDQFLQPVIGRRVTFSSSDSSGGVISPEDVNTDSEGFAQTVYTAGVTAAEITITATVEQTNN